jgi:hypothetical protein
MNPTKAKNFVEEILSEGFRELGETYLSEMKGHVELIQQLRSELRTKYDAVLELFRTAEGKPVELPADLKPDTFLKLFDDLADEIDLMKPPEEALKGVDETKAADELKQDVSTLPPEHPAAGMTDAQWKAEVEKFFAEWEDLGLEAPIDAPEQLEVPRVKGGEIEGIRVREDPWARRGDIQDIERLPGESQRTAAARVHEVIGQKISDTPLADAWNKAREAVLRRNGVDSVEQLGREAALKAYKSCQRQFWRNVAADPAALEWLRLRGFNAEGGKAALLRVSDPTLPVEQRRISLDHSAEKAFGDNWKLALDGDNLVLEFHSPNSFRDSVQRALKIGTYAE